MTAATAERSASRPSTAREPFGLYIHWPFCQSKCPYCDFNSHVRPSVDEDRWAQALLAELDHAAAEIGRRPLASIFFGGGTPSRMPPATVERLIDRALARFPAQSDIEITLEANPGSVETDRFRDFRRAGVGRVSVGVQALDDAALRFLGRAHDADGALRAIHTAASTFDRYSFDLIYARPGQDEAAWARELEHALELAGGHLSLYQLTIEPGTAFHTAFARGDFALPDEDLAANLYELTQARMAAAGLPAYEISNYARPGQESRHNLVYWRYGDYVGIGPGAHGRVPRNGARQATRRLRAPESWLAAVERIGHGEQEAVPISPEEQLEELLMMGLRLSDGIAAQRFRELFDAGPETLLDANRLASLVEGGFLESDSRGLRATAEGRQRLNTVLATLLG